VIKLANLLLHVSNSVAAEDFYCNQLGFRREFAHRADGAKLILLETEGEQWP
jgi:putative hemolysin